LWALRPLPSLGAKAEAEANSESSNNATTGVIMMVCEGDVLNLNILKTLFEGDPWGALNGTRR
jgi:hypothetical protein